MTDAANKQPLHLEDLVDDLRRLVERILEHRDREGTPLSFAQAEAELQNSLSLHLLDYISFLEAQDNIHYDRDRDVLLPGDAVDDVVEATAPWKDEVRFEFSKEIADAPLDDSQVEELDPDDDDVDLIDEGDDFGFDEVFQEGSEESLEEDSIEMEVSEEPSEVEVEPIEADDEGDDLGDESSASAFDDLEEASEPIGDLADDSSIGTLDDESSVETLHDDSSAGQLGDDTSAPDNETNSAVGDASSSDPASRRDRKTEQDDTTPSNGQSSQTPSKSMNDDNRRDRGSNRRRSSSSSPERYERIEEIGSGGVGTVYKGRHVALDRQVAIKEISNVFDVFADLQRDDIVDRFTEITRTQAAISHPAVLQIFDLKTDAEYPFVVSEYAPRGSLRRLIESDDDRHLTIALKYFIQILHGLNAAHENDVVHGSLKPENVVLDTSGNAKLSDFGLTTLVDLSGASNQVYVGVGTVSYMAPEQFEDPNAATVETDIYSLGIMFYEMLTGKVPGRRSPMPSSFYPEIPRKLDDIFDRMSMDEPEDRYQSIEAILTDFYGEDEIIDLLDRQSGVVFLRDPIEHGDARLIDENGEPMEAAAESEPAAEADGEPTFESAGSEPVDKVADGGKTDTETDAQDDADDDGEEVDVEEAGEADAEQDTSGDEDATEDEAEADDDEAEEEGDDAEEASEDDDSELADDEIDPKDIDPEEADDEVLNKLDEYSEMFDEEE